MTKYSVDLTQKYCGPGDGNGAPPLRSQDPATAGPNTPRRRDSTPPPEEQLPISDRRRVLSNGSWEMGGTMKTQNEKPHEGSLVRDIRTAPGYSARAARIEVEGAGGTVTSTGSSGIPTPVSGIVSESRAELRPSLGERLMERKLVQWTVGYVATASWLLQVTSALSQSWSWAALFQQALSLILGLGIIPAVVVAWYHGEKGRQRVCAAECALVGATVLASVVLVWSLCIGQPR